MPGSGCHQCDLTDFSKLLNSGWSVAASEMNFRYDWGQNDWSSIPLGIKLARLHKSGKLPVLVPSVDTTLQMIVSAVHSKRFAFPPGSFFPSLL